MNNKFASALKPKTQSAAEFAPKSARNQIGSSWGKQKRKIGKSRKNLKVSPENLPEKFVAFFLRDASDIVTGRVSLI